MRRLLAAHFARLWKTRLFWGAALLHAAFGLFRIYTIYDDLRHGYTYTTAIDEALFTYIMIEGLVMAVFISLFLGTEYSDGAIRNKLAAGHDRGCIYLAGLITAFAACCLFAAVYLLTVLTAGVPVLGGPALDTKTFLMTLAGTLATAAAFCSLYTLISMVVSHKSTSGILCLLLFFLLLICTTYVAAMLDAPEERLVLDMVDGEIVEHMEPNPRYLSEGKRAVYQFVLDVLPTGQASLYVMLEAKPLQMTLYSCVIVLLTTGGGMACFRRKDIR